MLTVSGLSKAAKVSADTVRHYVKIGLLNPTRHAENSYKLFTQQDISRLQFIRNAKTLGFTLKEIGEIIEHSEDGNSPCPRVREILQEHIETNLKKIEDMIALQKRMEFAMTQWNELPDGIPDGESVCYLIETIAAEEK